MGDERIARLNRRRERRGEDPQLHADLQEARDAAVAAALASAGPQLALGAEASRVESAPWRRGPEPPEVTSRRGTIAELLAKLLRQTVPIATLLDRFLCVLRSLLVHICIHGIALGCGGRRASRSVGC